MEAISHCLNSLLPHLQYHLSSRVQQELPTHIIISKPSSRCEGKSIINSQKQKTEDHKRSIHNLLILWLSSEAENKTSQNILKRVYLAFSLHTLLLQLKLTSLKYFITLNNENIQRVPIELIQTLYLCYGVGKQKYFINHIIKQLTSLKLWIDRPMKTAVPIRHSLHFLAWQ